MKALNPYHLTFFLGDSWDVFKSFTRPQPVAMTLPQYKYLIKNVCFQQHGRYPPNYRSFSK